jgi:hypothetical protein
MRARGLRFLVVILLACGAADGGAATVAAGRHWQISIDRIECEAATSRLFIGSRIRYLGPRGVVEAPVSQLVEGGGRTHSPRSLAWQGGSKPLAAWLSAGGLREVPANESGEVRFRFEVGENARELTFEFGDLDAIVLTRARAAGPADICAALRKPGQIQATRKTRAARVAGALSGVRVYREGYPCLPPVRGARRTVPAPHPPYLPEQLLVFGRGFLPNARQVGLPMGIAAAQSYAYGGLDDLGAYETAARRAVAADYPAYGRGLAPESTARYFAFNWGVQKAASGNEMLSIGIYAVRPCPK